MNNSFLELSAPDSARFDLVVARGRIDHGEPLPTPECIRRQIRDLSADIAIIRLPAGSVSPFHGLGFDVFHADTLVYYEKNIESSIPVKTVPGLQIFEATPDNLTAIETIALDSFKGYRSHYNANPLLDEALILEGYAEWAIEYLSTPSEHRATYVACLGSRIIAFATCFYRSYQGSAEIILNAVDPAFSRRGVYGDLLSGTLHRLHRVGAVRAIISTQVWNYAVQKVWARQGFALTRAYDTYHINSLLSCGASGKHATEPSF